MTTRTVTVVCCDRCKADGLSAHVRARPVVGRISDAAGGPSEDDIEELDLCCTCASVLLTRLLRDSMTHAMSANWVATVRSGK